VAAFVSAILRDSGRRLPLVLDADALNAIALAGWDAVTGLLSSLLGSSRVVVTPHPGEMSRLVGRPVAEIQADRLGTARRAARAWGVVVVLKGAGTVVAAPDGAVWLNATGNPGLATAGSGDVLAGAIATFLAQGLPPLEAALVTVSAHGLAGDLAARDIGRRGLLASDIAHRLPRALDSLAEATGYGPTFVAV
jgi:NAD(P)H-hydrate epimerase